MSELAFQRGIYLFYFLFILFYLFIYLFIYLLQSAMNDSESLMLLVAKLDALLVIVPMLQFFSSFTRLFPSIW